MHVVQHVGTNELILMHTARGERRFRIVRIRFIVAREP